MYKWGIDMTVEIRRYLTNNECYKSGRRMTETKGVMIHDVATPGTSPDTFVRAWNVFRPNGRQVMVHGFVSDTKLINTLPYWMRAWGCGSGNKGSGNDYYIQLEICNPSEIYFTNGWKYNTKDKAKTKKYILDAVSISVKWAVDRLLDSGIKVVNKTTVTSHYEAYQMGIAGNHGDPKGLLSLADMDMDDFRSMCVTEMNNRLKGNIGSVDKEVATGVRKGDKVKFKSNAVQWDGKNISKSYINKVYEVYSVAPTGRVVVSINGVIMYAVNSKYLQVEKKIDKDDKLFKEYIIRVTVEALNIRSVPGTSGKIEGTIRDKGAYTIVKVDKSGKWGLLKSGIGWIHLGYTRKI